MRSSSNLKMRPRKVSTSLNDNQWCWITVFVICSVIYWLFPVSSETVSLYGSVDDSNSTVNLLSDIMVNDQAYDPLDDYVILRVGQYDYRAYFSSDLDGDEIICLQYTPAYQYTPAQLSRYSVNNLEIIRNGYIYAGNTPGSARSSSVSQFNFQQIVIFSVVFIIILIGFHFFRKRFRTQVRGYDL